MTDDVQVSIVDVKPAAVEYVHITDPQCRNLNFGSGPRETWIALRANVPDDMPPDAPDSMLNQIPGEAFLTSKDPAWKSLDDFREQHGRHARIESVSAGAEPVRAKKK